jgi:trehalose synthase
MSLISVPISPLPLERYRVLLGDSFEPIEQAAQRARGLFEGRVVWHVNSTARGGGVVELLRPLLAYTRGAGVDTRWVVIRGEPAFFRITKRIHNRLHGWRGDDGGLASAEREVYERTLAASAATLDELVRGDDIVFLHDPQTAGMAPLLRRHGCVVVWRCHVGLDLPNDLARQAWDFLHDYVAAADAYVFSRKEFVWDGLPTDRTWIVAPSIDVFSPKNQELEPATVESILIHTGLAGGTARGHPVFSHLDGAPARVDRIAAVEQDGPIPDEAPLVTQVSRWDRLKDPVGVLECFASLDNDGAHLLLAAPAVDGVADDPEAAEVLAEVRRRRARLPRSSRERAHLACLPMDDADENAAIVNAIQRRSTVVLQKSLAEGFGLTVAEAMWKSRPVIASRLGGIQEQIVDGESGVLLDDPTDLVAAGRALDELLADHERARRMSEAAHQRVRERFLGTRHLTQYMGLLADLLAHRRG